MRGLANRVALMSEWNPTAKDYVQNGLVLQWDGIENSAYGVHNASLQGFNDIASGKYNSIKVGSDYSVTSKSVIINASKGYNSYLYPSNQSSIIAILNNASSFQIVAKIDTVGSTKWPGMCEIGERSTNHKLLWWKNTGVNRSYFACDRFGCHMAVDKLVASCSYSFDGTNTSFYLDDTLYQEVTEDNGDFGNYFTVGMTHDAYSKFEVYAMRVYNRVLTATEIAANYAIDKARFGLS